LAIGTTLPSILPSAVTGTLRYAREGLVDWRIVRLAAPVGMAASVGGSVVAHEVPGKGHLLMIATALLLAFTAFRMARGPQQPAAAAAAAAQAAAQATAEAAGDDGTLDTRAPRPGLVFVLVGALAGVLSGLLGIGGGVVMVPGFTELAKVPLKTAIATSLACVGIFAIPGTITHHLLGGIVWWPWAVLLAVGVVPGARIGARLAIRSSDVRLRRAVAIFLGAVAVLYLAGEIGALRHGGT
jgi:uncharacterized membrane protein YfcA